MGDENKTNGIPIDVAIGNLYLCNCVDDGSHVDVNCHQLYCDYASWYISFLKKLEDIDDE